MMIAPIAAKTEGDFLEDHIHPKFNCDIALMDRDGTIKNT